MSGSDEWFNSLDRDQRVAVITVVELLGEYGPNLDRPHADRITGSQYHNLKELRPRGAAKNCRVLFIFDPRREAILLLGGDKSGEWSKWYAKAIPQAEQLYEEYLKDVVAEGLLDQDPEWNQGATMGHKKWADIVGEIDPEMRGEIEELKEQARADIVAFNIGEVRRARQITQAELARRLDRSQPAISAMERTEDNKLSTIRSAVESMGGRLEIVAVFDDERIAIA